MTMFIKADDFTLKTLIIMSIGIYTLNLAIIGKPFKIVSHKFNIILFVFLNIFKALYVVKPSITLTKL